MEELTNELKLLNAIIKNILNYSFISNKDEVDLGEVVGNYITQIYLENPLMIADPYFDFNMKDEAIQFLLNQLEPILQEYYLLDIINKTVEKAMNIFYIHITPIRSYSKSFIRLTPNKSNIDEKLYYLKNVYQPEQRSKEWYLFRQNYLTASSAWKAFSSASHQNQLIYDKCSPLNIEKYSKVNITSPLHWGQKYEPVSIQWYENEYNTVIYDFGCIPHKNIQFLAASPDGINTSESNYRYGRMLEVKNIVNREINGNPKFEYWIQMQLQMETCDLNECDFLETKFIEYDSYVNFQNDGTFNRSQDNKMKGIIMLFNNNNSPLYEYCPLDSTHEEYGIW